MAILQIAGREGTGIGYDIVRVTGMMPYDVTLDSMAGVVAVVGLMVLLRVDLVLVGGLLLMGIEHRAQAALPSGRAIETSIMALLVGLAVHAPRVVAR
jgi:hypothetical protein